MTDLERAAHEATTHRGRAGAEPRRRTCRASSPTSRSRSTTPTRRRTSAASSSSRTPSARRRQRRPDSGRTLSCQFSDYLGDRRLFADSARSRRFSNFDIVYLNLVAALAVGRSSSFDDRTYLHGAGLLDRHGSSAGRRSTRPPARSASIDLPLQLLPPRRSSAAATSIRESTSRGSVRTQLRRQTRYFDHRAREDDFPDRPGALVGDSTVFARSGRPRGRR